MSKLGRLFFPGYYVCESWQYLIKTGLFTGGIVVRKSTVKLPGQLVSYINMHPITFDFQIHNMSKEKVEFRLPMVFTVAPIKPEDDMAGFLNYTIKTHNNSPQGIRETIAGIVEGETRTFTAEMTVEEMFSDKEAFKEKVIKKIELDMRTIGLTIINANIREMGDYDDKNKYFEYRKQRAIETANFSAQIDVAIAKRDGNIGVQERERDIRIALAQFDKESTLQENDRKKEIAVSNAELKETEAEANRRAELAKIQADMTNDAKRFEMLKLVEEKRREQEEMKYRASDLSKANIDAEVIERMACAHYFAKQKEAEGMSRVYEAQAEGLEKVRTAAGDPQLAMFYLGVQHNIYPQLAKEAANAVQNLNPKINVWNTGSNASSNPIMDLMKSFAPILDQVKDTYFGEKQSTTSTSTSTALAKVI